MSKKIRVALVGVGNCAASLIQGIEYYRDHEDSATPIPGVMHPILGGYHIDDIEFSCAFDINKDKVGQPLYAGVRAYPNNTISLSENCTPDLFSTLVSRGPTFDGLGKYLKEKIVESPHPVVNVAKTLHDTQTDIVINYLPVGSETATEFYANQAIGAGCGFVNCIPVFLASKETCEQAFRKAKLPIIGDDIKSQVGATIVHRMLARLFQERGVRLDRTYQINCGGNMDFYNLLERERTRSKKISKTEAVQSQLDVSLPPDNIHVGPSDYIPWLQDRKVCHIRMEGTGFGGVPIRLDVNMEVWDSPNSAGCVVDAIRCCKLAMDRKVGGALVGPSAYLMKHPPTQYTDVKARELMEQFIRLYGGCE